MSDTGRVPKRERVRSALGRLRDRARREVPGHDHRLRAPANDRMRERARLARPVVPVEDMPGV